MITGVHIVRSPWHADEAEILQISTIIQEAEKIAERGVKEIVLTGVNIGDFGKSTGESFTGSA